MELFLETLRKDERVTLQLRRLYEHLGYKKYRMGKFEEYQLYLENKNFLKSEHVITFNDMSGKLLALKPDVTLSIAKNSNADEHHTDKIYYMENVYRLSRQNQEYKEINQIGLEYMGKIDLYATVEVIRLAMESLAHIDEHFVLEFSHMGFIAGLLDGASQDPGIMAEVLQSLRTKNSQALRQIIERTDITPHHGELLLRLIDISGSFAENLAVARELVVNDAMESALSELNSLYNILQGFGHTECLHLDFSSSNDLDYYNGIIFQGYVEQVPRAILAGGRYDNLLHKLGKSAGAIGFALYMDDINRYYQAETEFDVDVVVLYEEEADCEALSSAIWKLAATGLRVRAEKEIPDSLRYHKLMTFGKDGLMEVPAHA